MALRPGSMMVQTPETDATAHRPRADKVAAVTLRSDDVRTQRGNPSRGDTEDRG